MVFVRQMVSRYLLGARKTYAFARGAFRGEATRMALGIMPFSSHTAEPDQRYRMPNFFIVGAGKGGYDFTLRVFEGNARCVHVSE